MKIRIFIILSYCLMFFHSKAQDSLVNDCFFQVNIEHPLIINGSSYFHCSYNFSKQKQDYCLFEGFLVYDQQSLYFLKSEDYNMNTIESFDKKLILLIDFSKLNNDTVYIAESIFHGHFILNKYYNDNIGDTIWQYNTFNDDYSNMISSFSFSKKFGFLQFLMKKSGQQLKNCVQNRFESIFRKNKKDVNNHFIFKYQKQNIVNYESSTKNDCLSNQYNFQLGLTPILFNENRFFEYRRLRFMKSEKKIREQRAGFLQLKSDTIFILSCFKDNLNDAYDFNKSKQILLILGDTLNTSFVVNDNAFFAGTINYKDKFEEFNSTTYNFQLIPSANQFNVVVLEGFSINKNLGFTSFTFKYINMGCSKKYNILSTHSTSESSD